MLLRSDEWQDRTGAIGVDETGERDADVPESEVGVERPGDRQHRGLSRLSESIENLGRRQGDGPTGGAFAGNDLVSGVTHLVEKSGLLGSVDRPPPLVHAAVRGAPPMFADDHRTVSLSPCSPTT